MKIRLELTGQEVRTAIQNHIVATRPDITKGRVIKIVLVSNTPADAPQAVVELDEQPPNHSGFKD